MGRFHARWPSTAACLLIGCLSALGQEPTARIVGVVTDSSGAAIVAAQVTILSTETGHQLRTTTSGAGTYYAAGLLPGSYEVRVETAGFRAFVRRVKVEVGRTSTLDVRLQVGAVTESVTVEAQELSVNPTQSTLEGVVTEALIRDIPLNGRNLLDLGQLEPGVQVLSDETITRGGFARISFAGLSGRNSRVTVDGIDIHDEHGGGVVMNFSPDAVREFQITRATPDVATGLTGSGAVNVVTNSGGNQLRGTAFVFWRDESFAARIAPEAVPFDREQLGFSLGGPFVRDRLFWFAAYERNNQDAAVATNLPPFPQFSRTWSSPSDERSVLGRIDWNATGSARLFLRLSNHRFTGIPGRSLGGPKLAPKDVVNNSTQAVAGFDLTDGRRLHSLRAGYTNYDNLSDIALDQFPDMPRTVDPGGRLLTLLQAGSDGALGGNAMLIGTHPNSPANRFQDTHEMRYDGSLAAGHHLFRWGALYNRIRINWFDSLFGHAPQVALNMSPAAIASCGSNILCYPVMNVLFGNGLGYFSEIPSHGQPFGGGRNDRFHVYVADSWRVRPHLNVNLGLRWVYEPGPTNDDLKRPAVLEDFLPGITQADRRDRNNFAPQVGLAWSPAGDARLVVRAAAGLFYESNRLQNVMFGERATLLPLGATQEILQQVIRDPLTNQIIFDIRGRAPPPGESPALVTPGCNWMGRPLGTPASPAPGACNMSLLDALFAAQTAIRAAYLTASANFPAGPSSCELRRTCRVLAPDIQNPYALHFNVGVQMEVRKGLVLSADYVRNRALHFLMQNDANRVGAADTLDVANALAAMNAVHVPRGCPAGAAGVQCAITHATNPATLTTYVNAGLGSGGNASSAGPSTAAFPGEDPRFNGVTLLSSSGFSNYHALQLNLRGQLPNAGRLVRDPFVIVSYALGRMEGTAEDQAIINTADRVDNNDPQSFRGPTTLDRTHILSVAGLFTIPGGVRLSSTWKAFSALPQNAFIPQFAGPTQEIFHTDLNGDGNGQELLPGTNRGSYGRDIGCGGAALNRLIDAYNTIQAGQLTLAGRALVSAGLFTETQLKALGAVAPSVVRAPEGQVCLDSFLTTDLRISRPFRWKGERITIEPALEWFNVFNVANYDLPDNKLSASLSGGVGSINGTTVQTRTNRAGGTGSFVLGAPRSWQLAIRVTF